MSQAKASQSHKKRRGPVPSAADRVPGGTPGDMRQAAEVLTAALLCGGILPRTLPVGARETSKSYDVRRRSVVASLVMTGQMEALPGAAALIRGMGLDVAALDESLARQDRARGGHLEANELAAAARDGQQLVGAARVLARGVVKAAVEAARRELPPAQAAALDEGWRPAAKLEDDEQQAAQDLRAHTLRLQHATRGAVADEESRRQLQQVLTGLGQGETFDQATLLKAADTLEALLGEEGA